MSEEQQEASQTEIQEIEFEQLQEELKAGNLILIDVRNPDELESQGAIPGAINIPLPEVPDVFQNLSDQEFKDKYGIEKTAKLVFSCKSGRRAEAAIQNISGIVPLSGLRLYKGSFMDWEAKGGAVTKSA